MGENPSRFKRDDLPVENVTWNDCKRFCEKTGLALPSETQWEWACRAGTAGDYGGTGNLDEMGWYKKNSGDKSHPVGEKKPNDFGLNDMHGNVREWCEDFDSPGSRFRVLRGGCWDNVAQYCRSAYRYRLAPSIRHFHIGFRPAWSSP